MSLEIPREHPRYESLLMRERIIDGCTANVVAMAGLIAHGRGEAFDYLIGEHTAPFAEAAVQAAAAAFLLARKPVISVNGNVAALCPSQLVALSTTASAPLEVNLFYRTEQRERAVEKALKDAGARTVFGVGSEASGRIPELGSERRRVDPRGILDADLVFVPLEDGDRTEALVAMGKRVITVDLNPLSRTAQRATITIVDNVIRAVPALLAAIEAVRSRPRHEIEEMLERYDNGAALSGALRFIRDRLGSLADEQRPAAAPPAGKGRRT